MRIILASESPRRRELLTLMGLDFTVVPSHAEERAPAHATPDEIVRAIALQKRRRSPPSTRRNALSAPIPSFIWTERYWANRTRRSAPANI